MAPDDDDADNSSKKKSRLLDVNAFHEEYNNIIEEHEERREADKDLPESPFIHIDLLDMMSSRGDKDIKQEKPKEKPKKGKRLHLTDFEIAREKNIIRLEAEKSRLIPRDILLPNATRLPQGQSKKRQASSPKVKVLARREPNPPRRVR